MNVESFQNHAQTHNTEVETNQPTVLKNVNFSNNENVKKEERIEKVIEEEVKSNEKRAEEITILKQVELDSTPQTTDVDEISVTTDVDKASITTDVDKASVTTYVDEKSVTTNVPPYVRKHDETYAYYKKPTSQTNLEKEEAGYVYLPSRFWSIPQKRPPACTPSAKPKVCPVYTDGVPDGALEWKLTARERQVKRSSNRPANAQHLRNPKNRYYYPGYYAKGDTYKHSC